MGMNRTSGKSLTGIEHLIQSVGDILSTPIGSRVMRRTYGSRLFQLVDSPVNHNTKIEFFAAAAEAIRKWEPRIKIEKIGISSVNDSGQVIFDLQGVILENGEPITMEGLSIT